MQSIDHLIDEAQRKSPKKMKKSNFIFLKSTSNTHTAEFGNTNTFENILILSILGEKVTGTYRFDNGFYGLTDMPATFEKTIDKTKEYINTRFAFLDDILKTTKDRSLDQHESKLNKVLTSWTKET